MHKSNKLFSECGWMGLVYQTPDYLKEMKSAHLSSKYQITPFMLKKMEDFIICMVEGC